MQSLSDSLSGRTPGQGMMPGEYSSVGAPLDYSLQTNTFQELPNYQQALPVTKKISKPKGKNGRFLPTKNKAPFAPGLTYGAPGQLSQVAQPGRRMKAAARANKRQWQTNYRITQISTPQLLNTQDGKKRFRITFKYQDQNTGKQHNATVRFGNRYRADYVDHGDVDKARVNSSKIRKSGSPFDAGYWDIWLLNNKRTIGESLADYSQSHKLL